MELVSKEFQTAKWFKKFDFCKERSEKEGERERTKNKTKSQKKKKNKDTEKLIFPIVQISDLSDSRCL